MIKRQYKGQNGILYKKNPVLWLKTNDKKTSWQKRKMIKKDSNMAKKDITITKNIDYKTCSTLAKTIIKRQCYG